MLRIRLSFDESCVSVSWYVYEEIKICWRRIIGVIPLFYKEQLSSLLWQCWIDFERGWNMYRDVFSDL